MPKPHPVDQIVGQRLRELRVARKKSQTELGQLLGVTFQQIQKYENAANRVSASRLYEIAQLLEVEVNHFFAGASSVDQPMVDLSPEELQSLEIKLVAAWRSIADTTVRNDIVSLVESLSRRMP